MKLKHAVSMIFMQLRFDGTEDDTCRIEFVRRALRCVINCLKDGWAPHCPRKLL